MGIKHNHELDQLIGTVRYHWTKAFLKKIVPLGKVSGLFLGGWAYVYLTYL
jgi:hypothetical protein